VFKTTDTVGRYLPKCKYRPSTGQRSGVVYTIPCSCGALYVGQTGRQLETRIGEHRKDFDHGTGAFKDHRDHTVRFDKE
jgi:predicted GIY-YIG superfamily endonuclease